MKTAVVVAWVTEEEKASFLAGWNATTFQPDWLLLQRDESREGCGATKNRGVKRAVELGYDVVVVLDGDCYACEETPTLESLVERHVAALEPQSVRMYDVVTDPPSRGTPYADVTIEMPVAASMGFWHGVPDYCGVRQLAFDAKPMSFVVDPIFGRYFPLCGMNVAFKPTEWWPWWQFIEVSRFDDIWMGWILAARSLPPRVLFQLERSENLPFASKQRVE